MRFFFSSQKKERIYKIRDMARADVFDYIEVFYNRSNRHSPLGAISPEELERAGLGVGNYLLEWRQSTPGRKTIATRENPHEGGSDVISEG